MTVNHWVGGSIPPIPAIRSVEQLVAQLTVNQPPYGTGGSNPSTPTKCDSSSVGRAPSFQVGGRRFESCLSLKFSLGDRGTHLSLKPRTWDRDGW